MMHMRLSVAEEGSSSSSSSSSGGAQLEYVCPHCGEIKKMNSTNVDETHMVYSRDYDNASTEVEVDLFNEYTKYDPTLPTIRIIPCPNEGCVSNAADSDRRADRDIIYSDTTTWTSCTSTCAVTATPRGSPRR